MKNKKLIIAIIIVMIIMLIPFPTRLKDGGSVEYKALLYKYTKIHRLNEKSSTGYEDGWELKILDIRVGGETNITIEAIPIVIVKMENQDGNKYSIYLEQNNRIIYLASNIEEVYYYVPPKDTLKNYLSSTFQTTDDGIKHLTDLMNNTGTLKDGGTKIYKSSKYDATIITCHTIAGNRDIYIGDYSMQFDNDSMCKSN